MVLQSLLNMHLLKHFCVKLFRNKCTVNSIYKLQFFYYIRFAIQGSASIMLLEAPA